MTSISPARRLLLLALTLIVVVITILFAIQPLINPPAPTPITIETTQGDAQIMFSADSASVAFPGDCVIVRWSVEGVRSVELNGSGVVGQSESEVCIVNLETYPTLEVKLPDDDNEYEYTLPIEVVSERPIYVFLFGALCILIVSIAETAYELWLERKPSPNRLNRVRPLTIAVILTPLVVTIYLVHFTAGASLYTYTPTTSDQILSWHQVATFRAASFNGGYYTLGEAPARAEFTHFSTKGPIFPMIYGTLAKVFGWELNSGPYYNLALLTLSLVLFVFTVKMSRRQLIAMGLLLLTYWPLLIYLPTTFQEGLHEPFAVCFATGFFILLARGKEARLWIKIALALLLLAASLTKISWAILFVPYFFYALNGSTLKISRTLAAVVAAGVFIGAAFMVFSYLSAPYPIAWRDVTAEQRGLDSLVQLVVNNVGENIARFKGRVVVVQLALIGQLIAVLVVSLYVVARRLFNATNRLSINDYWFHIFSLGGILAANFVLYDVYGWSGYRVFAPYMLLSLLLLIAFRRFVLIGLIVVSNVILAPAAIQTFHVERVPDFHRDMRNVHLYRTQLDGFIAYDPTTTNGWCNTLVLYGNFIPEYLAVPPGIGTSRDVGDALPPRSRWLMIPGTGTLADWLDEGRLNIELLTETTMGHLYRNLDAEC